MLQSFQDTPYVWLPLIIGLLFAVCYPLLGGRRKEIILFIPSLFTTLGVLGTFLGISIGLSDFNTSNISDSIPTLLSGLKSAFYTSIAGIILSIISRLFLQFTFKFQSVDSPETRELKGLSTTFNYGFKELADRMSNRLSEQNDLMKAVVGRIDMITADMAKSHTETINTISENTNRTGNLLSLIHTNTSETAEAAVLQNTFLKEHIRIQTEQHQNTIEVLNANNRELALKISDRNTKGLLEAMEKSVEMFQEKMEDVMQRLVKKNFDQLNNSVAQLNQWQRENKEILTHLAVELKEVVTANRAVTQEFAGTSKTIESKFSQTSQHILQITEQNKALTDDNGRLAKIARELEEITLGDNKFKAILEKSEATIESLRAGGEKFENGIDAVSEWMNKSYRLEQSMISVLAELKELSELKNINGEYWNDVKQRMQEGINIIANANKNLNNGLDNIDSQFKSNLNETFGNLDELIRGYIRN